MALDRPRRTQEQRSAAMRLRLLDATIACLVRYGYAGTTTTRVAEAAGVTRGAQVHHFTTKADLVTAALRHVATRRAEEALGEIQRRSESADPLGDALDLLWDIHSGPIFTATAELWIAARTDPALRAHLVLVEPVVIGALTTMTRSVFGSASDGGAGHQDVRHFLYTAMDTIRGLMISGYPIADEEQLAARWSRARTQLLTLASVMLDATAG